MHEWGKIRDKIRRRFYIGMASAVIPILIPVEGTVLLLFVIPLLSVIPPQAGIPFLSVISTFFICHSRPFFICHSRPFLFVIPAKAGIYSSAERKPLDPCFRGGDRKGRGSFLRKQESRKLDLGEGWKHSICHSYTGGMPLPNVIPAKAGIQSPWREKGEKNPMDPRFRRGEGDGDGR